MGSLDPTLSPGQRQLLSSLDVATLDVIGWNPQVNPINLVTLQDQAKQKLATKLGISLTSLNTNLAMGTVGTPDQSVALQNMVTSSNIYPWGWGTCPPCPTGTICSGTVCVVGSGWHQTGLWQYAQKETLQEALERQGTTPAGAEPVPESSNLLGLLGLAGLGLFTRLRKK